MASSSQDTYFDVALFIQRTYDSRFMDEYPLFIQSNYDSTFMDAYLHAIVSNYDELFDKLHLFNVAQRQFLQAISDDASEAVLRAYLSNTLGHMTDGANKEPEDSRELTMEERAHGRVRLEPELRDMLPRGRVYEKALERARNNRRIQEFLLTELEGDAKLAEYLSLNLPNSRRRKIACWAATCNFVHMVVALLHYRDRGDSEFLHRVLTIAVEYGYVELVERIPDQEEFAVNRSRTTMDFNYVHLREVGELIPRVDATGYLYRHSLNYRLTPLNLAAKLGNSRIVRTFLARLDWSRPGVGRALSLERYWALYWAAEMQHAEVIDTILLNKDLNVPVLVTVEKTVIERQLAQHAYWPWFPVSIIGQSSAVFLTPLHLASLYNHILVSDRLAERLEYDTGLSALLLQRRTVVELSEILMDIPDIQKYVKRGYREREKCVNAANTIIIVAALIASVTFAAFVTPPLGYSPFFGTANINVGAPIPAGIYPSFASVEGHPLIVLFSFLNAFSFASAILTLVLSSAVVRPLPGEDRYIGLKIPILRRLMWRAYVSLNVAVIFFLLTFLTLAMIVFPPFIVYTLLNLALYVYMIFIVCVFILFLLDPAPIVVSFRGFFVGNPIIFVCLAFATLGYFVLVVGRFKYKWH